MLGAETDILANTHKHIHAQSHTHMREILNKKLVFNPSSFLFAHAFVTLNISALF